MEPSEERDTSAKPDASPEEQSAPLKFFENRSLRKSCQLRRPTDDRLEELEEFTVDGSERMANWLFWLYQETRDEYFLCLALWTSENRKLIETRGGKSTLERLDFMLDEAYSEAYDREGERVEMDDGFWEHYGKEVGRMKKKFARAGMALALDDKEWAKLDDREETPVVTPDPVSGEENFELGRNTKTKFSETRRRPIRRSQNQSGLHQTNTSHKAKHTTPASKRSDTALPRTRLRRGTRCRPATPVTKRSARRA